MNLGAYSSLQHRYARASLHHMHMFPANRTVGTPPTAVPEQIDNHQEEAEQQPAKEPSFGRPRVLAKDKNVQHALVVRALVQLQLTANAMSASQAELDAAAVHLEQMVLEGFCCQAYSRNGGASLLLYCWASSDSLVKQLSVSKAAQALVQHCLRTVIRPSSASIVPPTAASSSSSRRGKKRKNGGSLLYVKRPAGEAFHFMYSYTCTPTVDADFVTMHDSRPAKVPVYVWRQAAASADGRRQELGSYIYNKGGKLDEVYELMPWVVVDTSAAFPDGLGVYAWRQLQEHELIGIYCGDVLGPSRRLKPFVDELEHGPEYDALLVVAGHVVSGKHSAYGSHSSSISTVITAVEPSSGRQVSRQLYDKEHVSWPGMFAHLLNDASGTSNSNNVRVTDPEGVMQATQVQSKIYNPFSGAQGSKARAAANAEAELLWPYGNKYHVAENV